MSKGRQRERLAYGTDTQRIYSLPLDFDHRSNLVQMSGADVLPLEHLVYLDNFEQNSATTGELAKFVIPDNDIGNRLRQSQVDGLQKPHRWSHLLGKAEFYGNTLDPSWASLNVGGSCSNRCVFCYTEWIRDLPDFSTNELLEAIPRVARIETVRIIVFTGGEPTVRKDLDMLVRRARDSGFTRICLQTNGRALSSYDKVESLKASGLTEVLISLHGATASVHDSLVGAKGAFSATCKGIANLSRAGIFVGLNVVICRQNYRDLPRIPELIVNLVDRPPSVRFSYPVLEGAAFDNRKEILVRFCDITPHLREGVAAVKAAGMQTETGTMPLCVGMYPHIRSTYTADDLRSGLQLSRFYSHNVTRGELLIKLSRCSNCSVNASCLGIQAGYLRHFPDAYEEFWPISNASL